MSALCAYLLFTSILSSASSWTLKSSESKVIPEYSTNISLECVYDGQPDGEETFADLLRIRLLKQDNGLTSSEWKTYAEIGYPNHPQPILANPNVPGVSVSGYLGQPRESHLSVTWSRASDDTVGSYRCEIDGFTKVKRQNKIKYTEVINITKSVQTVREVLHVYGQLRTRLEERRNLQNDKIRMLENKILNNWPAGNYALITDAYGCPNTPFSNFSAGYINVQTKTNYRPEHVFPLLFTDTHYTVSSGRNVITFNFCEMNSWTLDLKWPEGSYCLAHSGTCLNSFKYGSFRFYLDSLVNITATSGNLYYKDMVTLGSRFQYIDVAFCCRKDGDVNIPILLPNAKPFYLYRYGGTCQEVQDMDVTTVTIQLDTDNKERDYGHFSHADGTTNKGSVELCYYTKKKTSTKQTVA